ncbi:MAG: glycosyltransferase [Candidatus Omnitrophica bacterium]|nr:glycosyltransferase [Candidatus Omnitrophota bacterium]MDD5435921.1 glycosyltransferase [Candidatus Omnitrophota bacterium]
MPTVSVNIPCYNSAPHIRETIASVLGQTLKDLEVIVVDDGSTDDTGKIVASFNDARIKYHYQANKGLSNARNKAIGMSGGEYIAFLDHDDVWVPTKLEKQVSLLNSHPEVAFAYSNYFWLFPNGRQKLVLKGEQPRGNVLESFLGDYPIGILTAMVRRQTIGSLGLYFDEGVTVCEDYDFFVRLAYAAQAGYIAEPLAFYRIHAGMQSIKFGDRYADELVYVLGKLEKIYPGLHKKYAGAIGRMNSRMDFMRAKTALNADDALKARSILRSGKMRTGRNFFMLYCATYLPPKLLKLLAGLNARYISRTR